MLKQLVLSCLIGMASILYIVQQDPWIEQRLLTLFTEMFQDALACRMSCRMQSYSYAGTLELEDVNVMPPSGLDWSWHAKHLTISFSWLSLLLYGLFELTIAVEEPQIESELIDGKLAMQDHICRMIAGVQTDIHSFLKEFSCQALSVRVFDPTKRIELHLAGDIEAKKMDNVVKAVIDMYDGSMVVQDRMLFAHMSGSLQVDSFDGQPMVDLCLNGAASVEIPQLGTQVTPCYISGSWHHNRGLLSLKNIDHSFVLDPIVLEKKEQGLELAIDAKVPLAYVWRMITNNNADERLQGTCLVQAKMAGEAFADEIQGSLITQRMLWQDMQLGSLAKLSFKKQHDTMNGTVYIQRTSGACAGGDWSWKLGSAASACLKNNARLTFSPKHDWQILPDDMTIELACDGMRLGVTYAARATHAKLKNNISSQGSISIDEHNIQAHGVFDNNQYTFSIKHSPDRALEQFVYARPDGTPLLTVTNTDGHYEGQFAVACVKDLLKKRYDFDLQGEGTFHIDMDTQKEMRAQVHLKDGTIRLPRTYNFINGFDCALEIDLSKRSCAIHDFVCRLHNGRLTSKKISLDFTQGITPHFVHAPILIEKCLLNMGKELFAVISGNLLLEKRSDLGACLRGQIVIDRSQLKENIFSDVFQKNVRSFTARSFETNNEQLQCDVAIKTKSPVRVQTPFLETDARIDLHIKHTVRDPQVTGTIQLNTGKLHFPYKPLYITKGALHFLPGHADDPVIELSAKNMIKQHNISLQVTGSLHDQHVRLESSPTLTEEQIVSLLLVGSQEESLNMVMPALIMQNLKSVLFGEDQSAVNLSRYFNALFKPFGRIHLVPSFIDQSGRGGLRGAIEIDLSDRWRAVIQKNFSLTEDTRFELEHLLSDDISLRVVRDIRRDLIGEVEMRYKFGNS